MRFRFGLLAITAAAAIAVLGPASSARATLVTYTTVGVFSAGDAAGTNVYLDAAHGIDIVFNGIVTNSVNVPPTSSASFGAFDTSASTAATNQAVASNFTLDIFQTTPTPGGPLVFVGALSGTLSISNSQAFIQFNGPLSQMLGNVRYAILSADNNTPGRLNLVPPTTNAGVSTLQGQISIVPEPSAVVLMGLGTCGVLLSRYRHRKAVSAA